MVDLEVSGWVFEGFRSHRMRSRETALGLGVAICLHVVVPVLVVFLGLLFNVPSVSEPSVVTVSLVSLPGAGNGSGGSPGGHGAPGSGAAGSEGNQAFTNSINVAVAVQNKVLKGPQKAFVRPAKPAERVSTRRPVHSRRRRKKAAPAPPHHDTALSEPLDRPVSATGGASLEPSAPASGAGAASKGGPAGGDSLPGGGGGGTGGRGGVPGFGTGSGGFDLREVDTPPVPIRKVQPEFPDEARQMGISGRVVLRFLVKADGKVAKASVISARPEGVFNQSALEAIGEWRFKPGLYRGKPVAVWVELPVRFRLSR